MARTPYVSPSPSLQQGSFKQPSLSQHYGGKSRIHRRVNSDPPLVEEPFPPVKTVKTNKTPKSTQEAWSEWTPTSPPPAVTNNTAAAKIRPYLRKLSTKDMSSTTIDLSLPAAENPSLTGLGIDSISTPDVPFSPAARGRHNRSTSNTSQFSTNSGFARPTQPYAPPMRQTPRPYTPPVNKSYTGSVMDEGDSSDEAGDTMSPDELNYRQQAFNPSRRSGSISSMPPMPPPLHMHSSSSLTRLASPSTSSLPFATRSRGDTMNTMKSGETASPSSRTSIDKAVSFIKGDREPIDAASRAASIAAARQAFQEKEEAKERREVEKQLRKEEKQRRRSESDDKRKARTAPSTEQVRPVVGGREYSKMAPASTHTLPVSIGRPSTARQSTSRAQIYDEEKQQLRAKSRWNGFVAWLRTRLLKMGRKIGLTS